MIFQTPRSCCKTTYLSRVVATSARRRLRLPCGSESRCSWDRGCLPQENSIPDVSFGQSRNRQASSGAQGSSRTKRHVVGIPGSEGFFVATTFSEEFSPPVPCSSVWGASRTSDQRQTCHVDTGRSGVGAGVASSASVGKVNMTGRGGGSTAEALKPDTTMRAIGTLLHTTSLPTMSILPTTVIRSRRHWPKARS